ncbi:MAG: amidohydrolase [Tissierellia bacterium]|nr:amidohydrolase [Tissierellia bacterium]
MDRKIYFGGDILTMENGYVESVVVEGERIIFTGEEKLARQKYEDLKEIDLRGLTMLPGFIDTHCHLSFGSEMISQPGVYECKTKAQVLEKISRIAEEYDIGEAIFVNGYEENPMIDSSINIYDLNEILPFNPVFLRNSGTHGTYVNSLAIDIVIKEAESRGLRLNYQRDGLLRDAANLLALEISPSLISDKQKNKYKKKLIEECSSNGITAVHTMEGRRQHDDPEVKKMIEEMNDYPFHMKIYYQTTDVDEVKKYNLKQIGGCFNCILDGDIDPGTAAFTEAYENDESNYGRLYFSDEELINFFGKAHREGLQICVHAIGDAAIKQAIDAYETVLKENPKRHRHRIEHFEIASDELISKAKNLNLVLAMQPVFDYHWPRDNYKPYIGEKRADMKCRLRKILDNGIKFGSGSDFPVTEMNPFLGINGAVFHSVKSSRISVYEALKSYTIDAAYIGFQEEDIGSIRVGKYADFVILSQNPLKVNGELDKINIIKTIFKGREVWNLKGDKI